MEVIYTLIPGMVFLGLIMVVVLIWAVKKGQYDDMEGDGQRLLMDDDEEMMPGKEEQQVSENKEADGEKKKAIDRRNWPDADD